MTKSMNGRDIDIMYCEFEYIFTRSGQIGLTPPTNCRRIINDFQQSIGGIKILFQRRFDTIGGQPK